MRRIKKKSSISICSIWDKSITISICSVGMSFVLFGLGRGVYLALWDARVRRLHVSPQSGLPRIRTRDLKVFLVCPPGTTWGGHSVMPLTGTEPNILRGPAWTKTNDVPTCSIWDKSITNLR